MKEPVHKTKHPYLVGVCVAGIAALYLYLVSGAKPLPEPAAPDVYDIKQYTDVDNVDTRFSEAPPIAPRVDKPRAMAFDQQGRLYVAGTDAIAVLDEAGKEVSRAPIQGTPTCLAFAPDGRLLVGLEDRVDVLDNDLKKVASWGDFTKRSYITAMAADDSEVYLADAASRCVLRVDYNGKVLNRIGEADEKRDVPGLEVPSPHLDLALDDDGLLWVVNPGKLGLECYRSNGDIVTSWYHPSLELAGFSGCCNPTNIAFNKEGRLVTCEKGLVRVKIYEVTAGSFEELVVGSKAFNIPQSVGDMVVAPDDRIPVLDGRKDEIRVFETPTTTVAAKPETLHVPGQLASQKQ